MTENRFSLAIPHPLWKKSKSNALHPLFSGPLKTTWAYSVTNGEQILYTRERKREGNSATAETKISVLSSVK